jgi:serine/threonine protein kinase
MSELAPTSVSRARPEDLIPGYRLLELVGKGGMGEVHRATQLSLERRVAVKLLAQNLAGDAGFVARFEKEAAALAQLSHPNIVSIVDKGRAGETYYLVMEFVEGPSLRELISAGITASAGLRAIAEVARAIDYAHGRGVIHRDLKPENILVDAQAGNICKVSDFGLAGFLDDGPGRFRMTATHVAMGTLAYMAPEQRVDARNADHRADLYSLGVMLYELLTGEAPMGAFSPPSQRKPGVDPRLDPIVARCLQPDPRDRYPRVTELLVDLEPLVQSASTPVSREPSTLDLAVRRVRRVVRFTARVAAATLLAAAAAILAVTLLRNSQPPAPRELPGALFSQELPVLSPMPLSARVADGALSHRVTFGVGPDTATVVPAGQPLELQPSADGTVRFEAYDPRAPVGRATLDVAVDDASHPGRPFVAVKLAAQVLRTPPAPSVKSRLRQLLLGESPTPRAALTLHGLPGRQVSLVLGPPGEPVALEWVFGERRGAMLGPASPEGATELSMEIDAEGTLRAFVGTSRDQREVGEPLALHRGWRTALFGFGPVPELGCAEAHCQFGALAYELGREPEPEPAPVAVAAPPVQPAPVPARPVKAAPPRHEKVAHAERAVSVPKHDAVKASREPARRPGHKGRSPR